MDSGTKILQQREGWMTQQACAGLHDLIRSDLADSVSSRAFEKCMDPPGCRCCCLLGSGYDACRRIECAIAGRFLALFLS